MTNFFSSRYFDFLIAHFHITLIIRVLFLISQCESGKYGDTLGKLCKSCISGQYRTASMDATICKGCPSGWGNENNGSTSCNKVPPGFFTVNGAQSTCQRGFTCAGINSPPQQCSKGTYTNSTGSVSCIPCSPGKFASSLGSLKCEFCPRGYLQDQPKKSFCDKVKAGQVVAEGGSASIQVPLGSKICDEQGDSCQSDAPFEACAAGKYGVAPTPTTECYNCKAGESSSQGATRCQVWYVM